jgi:hypothetical protein
LDDEKTKIGRRGFVTENTKVITSEVNLKKEKGFHWLNTRGYERK